LGNAVKYGREEGLVRIHVEVRPKGVRVAVWNEGPGFHAEERPRLFRRFSRLRDPELLEQKGTGVGLYTSWRIVRLHGGSMDARSSQGEWAEFSLDIPQPLPDTPAQTGPVASTAR
jgi:signal transduction histidine kinase